MYLRCTLCDAWYTWNPNTEEFWTEPRDVSFEEAADLIRSTWRGPSNVQKRVIFTGGEPLIQKKQIAEVVMLLGPEWKIEFETNGTLMPTAMQLSYGQFNCSPKLSNSDNQHHSMVRPKVLAALNEANTNFKFVCYNESDLDEIEEKYLPHISKDKIVIMPQGIRSEEIDENMRALYEPCMARGYRMLGRMQSQFADGARRGV
jgi:7-carboxy-7-deazaguanine synthase